MYLISVLSLMLGFLLGGTGEAFAQATKTVSGTVSDENGEPIISGTVMVKDTKTATVTDFDGNFKINAPANGTLVFSYLGYFTQEIPVAQVKGGVLNVQMKPEDTTLDELVVVGYGVMRKSDVTGSIGIAKGDDMKKNQNFSAIDNLRGKVSGVNVFSNSSQPGAYNNKVVIRGMATINSSTDPLYVVDGVVMEGFGMINPNDIESMEVLKDASATAIYGARGANGVILVTTKRGLKNEEGTRISYDGSFSISTMARKMDVLNAQEWCDAFMQGLQNENTYMGKNWSLDRKDWFIDSNYFDANGNPLYDTDWQDEATRTAFSHNHQISIQQAGKKSSMGAFLNYTDQQGIVLDTYSKRVNAKMTYDANPTEWLSTAVNLTVNHTWTHYTPEDGGGQDARRTMIEMLPWLPVKDKSGNYTTTQSISNEMNNLFGFEAMTNPVAILKGQTRANYRTQLFGNAAFTFHLLDGLDLKTQFGVDYHHNRGSYYSSRDLVNLSQNEQGVASISNSDVLYWQEETYLTYNKVFDIHRINAMAGLSWQERTYDYNYMYTQGFSDDFYKTFNMAAGTKPNSPESNWNRWRMNSYFLRLAYTLKDRYSATVTARVDGSSKFGKNNKYAFFPSAGLAWNISQEDFMKDIKAISNLKLHTSYGLTGNSEISPYQSLARVSSGTMLLNNQYASYSYVSSLANPDLKWEKTAQFDLGFNLGLFQDRLNFDVSYYHKKTTDLLLDCPVPYSTGFTSMFKNIGSVKNQGLDIMVSGTPFRTKDFTWTSTLNLNYNKNEITKLGENNEDIGLMNWVGGYEGVLRVGESMGSFYGYRRLGVWTKEDFAAGKCEQKQIGRAKRTETKEILGKGIPDWTGSWVNTFNYKNWDLTLDMQFVWGVETMQQFYHSTYDRFGITNGLSNILYDAYNGTNPGAMEQMIYLANNHHAGQDTTVDSSWVVDGSYLRCNMLQIGYTFDRNLIKPLGLSGLRVYASANNLFMICSSDFNGYDPESTSQTDSMGSKFGQNASFFSYPRARTFTLGLSVAF